MTPAYYQPTKRHFSRLQTQLAGFSQLLRAPGQTSLTPRTSQGSSVTVEKPLMASRSVSAVSSADQTLQVNANAYAGGVLVKNRFNTYTNALYSASHTKKVQHSFFVADVNADQKEDLVLWDTHSVYVKYGNQQDQHRGAASQHHKKFYLAKPITHLPTQASWVAFDADTLLKVSDVHEGVKNFRMQGQSFDQISFSFKQQWELDAAGYLIKLTHRIDHAPEKQDYHQTKLIASYLLLLPNSRSLEGLQLSFPYL